ncbi:MAG: hypothetical protein HYV96_07375 [Opitutae bacterium]|nr:hypothetical protein [Opitutae bacterium]
MNVHHFDFHEALHSRALALRVVTVLAGLFVLAHFGRLLLQLEIRIAGHAVPLWLSLVAMVIGGAFAWWLGSLAFRKDEKPPETNLPASDR